MINVIYFYLKLFYIKYIAEYWRILNKTLSGFINHIQQEDLLSSQHLFSICYPTLLNISDSKYAFAIDKRNMNHGDMSQWLCVLSSKHLETGKHVEWTVSCSEVGHRSGFLRNWATKPCVSVFVWAGVMWAVIVRAPLATAINTSNVTNAHINNTSVLLVNIRFNLLLITIEEIAL